MQDTAEPTGHVFVSYAREDLDFVRRLCNGLGQKAWVDLEGVFAGEKYWPIICEAIDGAIAVIAVLSPDYINSSACGQESDYAVSHNKRLIPIVCRDVEEHQVPWPHGSGYSFVTLTSSVPISRHCPRR